MDSTGIILCGGLSTRFGSTKADAQWNGHSLAAAASQALRVCCARIIAVARIGQPVGDWEADQVAWDDLRWPEGPLRGVLAGLDLARTETALVLPCDQPLPKPALLMRLQERFAGAPVAFRVGQEAQPFPSLWPGRMRDQVRDMLEQGIASPRRALRNLDALWLDEREWRPLDPAADSFRDCDTPAALAGLQKP